MVPWYAARVTRARNVRQEYLASTQAPHGALDAHRAARPRGARRAGRRVRKSPQGQGRGRQGRQLHVSKLLLETYFSKYSVSLIYNKRIL